ncbi:MAG: uroporphyrinogen-III C-methyltransferase [Syntrophales bacterium]
MKKGIVYIIGAGPGDPGLITLKGAAFLSRADVVIYDHLASGELLRHARSGARLIYAGKKGGDHTLSQDELNGLIACEAERGNVVARLKGGDPFIFGRGGEEAEILARLGIPFEVVPGVTSAISAPAYAGIPLTHREYTSTVAFVTGHEDPSKEKSDIDWRALACIGTLVFLMGVKNLSRIAGNLIASGKDPGTPAALIRWGTTSDQETVTGTLENIARRADEKGVSPPAVLVVGGVVDLRSTLDWFEKKPLFGKGIVITRTEEQSGDFAELLREKGARPILFPTIRIAPVESRRGLDRALAEIEKYHWIVFTSANGVRAFFSRLMEKEMDARSLKGIGICAIGPATASLIRSYGIRADIVPEEYISEGIVAAFRKRDLHDKRVLLPRAEKARDVLPEELAKLGAQVDVVAVYRTVGSGRRKSELDGLIRRGEVDVITFTSPSTVIEFMNIMGDSFRLPGSVRVACIGPVTAAQALKSGLRIDIMQEQYTIPAMVEALEEYYRKPRS